MLRLLFSIFLAILTFCVPAPAQDSPNVTGYYIGEPGAQDVSRLIGPGAIELLAPSLPFRVPKWDGRDAEGNPVPWNYLRRVQVSLHFAMVVTNRGENASHNEVGLWQVETGVNSYFSRLPITTDSVPQPPLAWGGAGYVSYEAGGEHLSAFDGTLDGQGPSGWTQTSSGSPFIYEYRDIGVNRADLRAWCGSGDTTIYWSPRQHTVAHGFAGHWASWPTASVRVMDLPNGGQISVRYILGAPPLGGSWYVQNGPWSDYGLIRDVGESKTLDLVGSNDPSHFLAAYIDYAEETGRWIGVENTASFSATCGGTSSGGVRIFRDGNPIQGLWSNSSAGVGTFAPVSAYDGVTDWDGWSGRETFQSAYMTGIWRTMSFDPAWAGDVPVRAEVSHAIIAPESLTPGADFAWDGKWRFSGRVRKSEIKGF